MSYNQPNPYYNYGASYYGNIGQPNQMGNPYQQFMQYPQSQQQQQMMASVAPQQIPQVQTLNGKFVDSVDVVRATEVPMGGSGFFPKADMTEIYIKSWNNDGTTNIVTYKPVVEKTNAESVSFDSKKMDDVLTQLTALNKKMDKLSNELGS